MEQAAFQEEKSSSTSSLTIAAGTGKILSIHPPFPMTNACKHPQVRVVAREDDVEFVECQLCREVFDAAEYVDMAIEEEELSGDPFEIAEKSKTTKSKR